MFLYHNNNNNNNNNDKLLLFCSFFLAKGTHCINLLLLCSFNFFLSVGDCIVAVNDSSTVNVTHQQAVEALKAAGGVVTLVMIICDDDYTELFCT